MRINYSRKDFDGIYERIVHSAECSLNKNDITSSLNKVSLAAYLQYNVNSCFSDERLEKLLCDISGKMFSHSNGYTSNKNKVLFYDYFGISNRGLTQQYLDALFQIQDIEICYVLEHRFSQKSVNILNMIEAHGSKCYELKQSSIAGKTKELYEIICKELPSIIFYHISPWSPVPIVATTPFKNIKKYLINITDHAFGLGDGNFFDYSYEFREYGCKVSIEKRHFNHDQLILLPYYPWQENMEFLGFPIDTQDKVILFSGGYIKKIEDPENIFIKIISRILNENSNTIFFFAGGGDLSRTQKLIDENKLSERIFLLGNRVDIGEIFKYIDIYVGTYPNAGGLMSQYASTNGIPILAYKTHEIESIVCNKRWMNFVFDTIDELVIEASHLINDRDYRKKRGAEFKSLTASRQEFRQSFYQFFFRPMGLNKTIEEVIDYDNFCQSNIDKYNSSNKLSLEHQIFKYCYRALSWKFLINILLNFKVIINKIYGRS